MILTIELTVFRKYQKERNVLAKITNRFFLLDTPTSAIRIYLLLKHFCTDQPSQPVFLHLRRFMFVFFLLTLFGPYAYIASDGGILQSITCITARQKLF